MKISVVIPAFNAATTLAQTLDSIASQTRKPHEVIVVDDGSVDKTPDVAHTHTLKPIVITQPNSGAATAINAGIARATGELVSFLDSDDLWHSGKLQIQERVLAQDNALAGVLGHSEAFECPSVAKERFASMKFIRGATPGYLIGTLLVRKDCFRDELARLDSGLRTGYFIDWFRMATAAGLKFHMVDEVVHKRRIRPSTLGARKTGSDDSLSRDFLEIARRALAEKRNLRGKP